MQKSVKVRKIEDAVRPFVEMARSISENITKACDALLQLCQEFGEKKVFKEVQKQLPALTEHVLHNMCAVALKHYPGELLLDDRPGARFLKGLPFDTAKHYIEDAIMVVVETDKGYELKERSTASLADSEVRQCFDGVRYRESEEQITWLKKRNANTTHYALPKEAYTIVSGFLVFNRGAKVKIGVGGRSVRKFFDRILKQIESTAVAPAA